MSSRFMFQLDLLVISPPLSHLVEIRPNSDIKIAVGQGEDILALHPRFIGLRIQVFDPPHSLGIWNFSKVNLGR